MKLNRILKSFASIALSASAAFMLAALVAPNAMAQCGLSTKLVKPSSWNPQIGGAYMMHVALADDGNERTPSIVGMWHVKFAGDVFSDDAIVQWHSDGTEIMNSERPPAYGNFCLGVWKQMGRFRYFLNHIPWKGLDQSGNPQDGIQLLEEITLSPDGNSYTGTYSFTPYEGGTAVGTFTGTITATRITPSTPFSSLL